METPNPKISVVAPMRNEGPNVLRLADSVFQALDATESSFEFILVDDGSTDDTWAKIGEAWRTHRNLRGLRHSHSAGQSAALWTGFKASRGPIIATLDGDLQNDPADLPRLIKQLTDCDMVCGVRTQRADGFVRRGSSSVARAARKLILGVDFPDTGCNLRAFKRSVLELLPAFDGIHRFMPVLAHNGGAVVKQIPVGHHPRTQGRSKYGVWNRLGRGICDLLMVRWYMKRQIGRNPVKIEENSSVIATAEQLAPR